MELESINQYLGKNVILTLNNGFWYKARIIEVKEHSVNFIELKGRLISVDPKSIILIEEKNLREARENEV